MLCLEALESRALLHAVISFSNGIFDFDFQHPEDEVVTVKLDQATDSVLVLYNGMERFAPQERQSRP